MIDLLEIKDRAARLLAYNGDEDMTPTDVLEILLDLINHLREKEA